MFLKIALTRGVLEFGKKGKLSPKIIGPFEILERIEQRVYRVALSSSLSVMHNVFHVFILKKYTPNPTHVKNTKHFHYEKI